LIDTNQRDLEHLTARVRALSPAATLDRGYAIVTNEVGEIVRDASTLSPGEFIRIRVARGAFQAQSFDSTMEES
jgi:exodeoxyribonuclease VII large subunit